MKHAYVFPGQGSQFPGMAKTIVAQQEKAREVVQQANTILGFDLSSIEHNGRKIKS